MFATATFVARRGATRVSREDLTKYEPPEATATWKPVKHALIVDLMHEELDRRDIQVTKEEYAIQREGHYLFAALTLDWLRDEHMSAALAFRHSNDKSEAMKLHAGVHVFVCDNMALSGDEIILNRKHTTRLNVAAEPYPVSLCPGVDRGHPVRLRKAKMVAASFYRNGQESPGVSRPPYRLMAGADACQTGTRFA